MTTWYGWNNTYSMLTTTDGTWQAWNFGIYNSTSTSTTVTWNQWATTGETASSNVWQSEEEREAARVASEESERQRKEAEERAEKILIENLDEEQEKSYGERNVIPITTAKGRKYLIKKGRAGNVYRIDEQGKEVERFCIHPEEYVPDQDTMLSQLMWLRWCEEEFLQVANMTRLAA